MLVTPATELLAMDGSCLPGPSDFDVRRPCLFPRRPTARITFLSGKVTKAIGAGHNGLANTGWLDFAALLAPSGPARTRASLRQTVAPCSRFALRCSPSCDGAGAHLDTAIHGLLSNYPSAFRLSLLRHRRRLRGDLRLVAEITAAL